ASNRAVATPRPRWLIRVIILAISARCGWLGGSASCSVTVPIRISPSKAPRTIRSPRPADASESRQKRSAASGASGCMKLTEPPFATVSIRISPSAPQTCGEASRGTILMSGIASAPGENDDIAARSGGFVGKGHLGGRAESQAIAASQRVPLAGFDDHETARPHPDRLANMRVGRGGEHDPLSGRQFDLDDLQGMIGPVEYLLAQIAGAGVAPDGLFGRPGQPSLVLRPQAPAAPRGVSTGPPAEPESRRSGSLPRVRSC